MCYNILVIIRKLNR